MAIFCEFEIEVLRQLVAPKLEAERFETIIQESEGLDYHFSGSGYFLTVRHPELPTSRIACAEPAIIGRCGRLLVGFVAFAENRELTLECHGWGGDELPLDFREQRVLISLA